MRARLILLLWLAVNAHNTEAGNPLNTLFGKQRAVATSEVSQPGIAPESVSAGANSAAGRLFARMAQSKLTFGLELGDVDTRPTPVSGLYELVDRRSGQQVAYTNESGTLYGDSRGFRTLQPTGDRPLTADENAALRREMLAKLDTTFLVRVNYGDGGGRRMLLRSAIDCSGCKMMEGLLARHAGELNTTFLVFPSSLAPYDAADGPARWEQAARFLCANQGSGEAWKTYWHNRTVPEATDCKHDGESLATAARQFDDLTMATVDRVGGVPRLYDENGASVPAIQQEKHAPHLERFYGPSGMPVLIEVTPSWLQAPP